MLANMLYLSATQRGLLSVVAVVASLYPAVTVTLAPPSARESSPRNGSALVCRWRPWA